MWSINLQKKTIVKSLCFPLLNNKFYFKIYLNCNRRKINLFVILSLRNECCEYCGKIPLSQYYIVFILNLLMHVFMQEKLFPVINLAYFTLLYKYLHVNINFL